MPVKKQVRFRWVAKGTTEGEVPTSARSSASAPAAPSHFGDFAVAGDVPIFRGAVAADAPAADALGVAQMHSEWGRQTRSGTVPHDSDSAVAAAASWDRDEPRLEEEFCFADNVLGQLL